MLQVLVKTSIFSQDSPSDAVRVACKTTYHGSSLPVMLPVLRETSCHIALQAQQAPCKDPYSVPR